MKSFKKKEKKEEGSQKSLREYLDLGKKVPVQLPAKSFFIESYVFPQKV